MPCGGSKAEQRVEVIRVACLFIQQFLSEWPFRVTKLRECLDAPNVGVRIGFKRLCAQRATKRNHPVAVLDAGEPFVALDCIFANHALNGCAVEVAGVIITHTSPFRDAVRSPASTFAIVLANTPLPYLVVTEARFFAAQPAHMWMVSRSFTF